MYFELDGKFFEATKNGVGQVKFNPDDGTMSGWVWGMPFPAENFMMDDPIDGV